MYEPAAINLSIRIARLTQALPFLPFEEQMYVDWEICLCEEELEAIAASSRSPEYGWPDYG